jgi:hypothetical protein
MDPADVANAASCLPPQGTLTQMLKHGDTIEVTAGARHPGGELTFGVVIKQAGRYVWFGYGYADERDAFNAAMNWLEKEWLDD